MIQLRMIQNLQNRPDRAGFRIVRTIDEPFDSSVHHRSGTHRTRFNCNKQLAVSQTVVTKECGSFAQRDDFGVCSRIGVGDVPIETAAHDFALKNNDGSDGNFADLERALGAPERFVHPQFVGDRGQM